MPHLVLTKFFYLFVLILGPRTVPEMLTGFRSVFVECRTHILTHPGNSPFIPGNVPSLEGARYFGTYLALHSLSQPARQFGSCHYFRKNPSHRNFNIHSSPVLLVLPPGTRGTIPTHPPSLDLQLFFCCSCCCVHCSCVRTVVGEALRRALRVPASSASSSPLLGPGKACSSAPR